MCLRKRGKNEFSTAIWSDVERLLTLPPFISYLMGGRRVKNPFFSWLCNRNYFLFRMKRAKTINHKREYFMLGWGGKFYGQIMKHNHVCECVCVRVCIKARWEWIRDLLIFSLFTFRLFTSRIFCNAVSFPITSSNENPSLLDASLVSFKPRRKKFLYHVSRFSARSWSIAIYSKMIDMI